MDRQKVLDRRNTFFEHHIYDGAEIINSSQGNLLKKIMFVCLEVGKFRQYHPKWALGLKKVHW